MIELFNRLNNIDKSLLAVLLVSLFFKYANSIIIFIVLKNKTKDKERSKKCIHLIVQDKQQYCEHDYFSNKYFINNKCEKKKCSGYKTSNFTINDLKESNIWWSMFISISNTTAELSSIILIIRTLLTK